MKVHHISAGTLCPHSARFVNGSGGWLDPASMVCHCWLIETDDGLVLVDTGIGTEDLDDLHTRMGWWFGSVVRPRLGHEHTALARVRALGFAPEDVRHIIPTHLDLDHAGGIPDFPWATVHVFRPEYEAAMNRATFAERERYRPAHWSHGPTWDVREDEGEDWYGFRGVRALDSTHDVLLVPLLGHSRGHCGVAVRSKDGWLLHAGDAYFFHGEMVEPPSCPPGLALFQRLAAFDDVKRRANQARLRAVVAGHDEVRVHSAHCPVEFARFDTTGR